MAIDQERAFWDKWIADYEGPNIESEIACQFARAYAAECVRAERERCLSIAKGWGSYEAEVIADGIARGEG